MGVSEGKLFCETASPAQKQKIITDFYTHNSTTVCIIMQMVNLINSY